MNPEPQTQKHENEKIDRLMTGFDILENGE